MNFSTGVSIAGGGILVLAILLLWAKSSADSTAPLRSYPSIPAITTATLSKVPDTELLDRIYLECLRRIYNANKGFLAGPEVLGEQACHLWVIAMLEERLLLEGFRSVIKDERTSGSTPLSPSLDQLRKAYLGLGLEVPGELIQEALSIQDPGDEDRDPYARIASRFRKAVGSGTNSIRLAYAKRRINQLFPDSKP